VIAALFVRADGPYAGRDDVDAWDVERDARTYAGPWPVVAHPPCARWSRLASIHAHRWPIGDDGGTFRAALAAVNRWGGVLEHPASTYAWAAHGLQRPRPGGGWSRSLFGPGWVCEVEQGRYGHPAPKATWLYYVGPPPAALLWGPSGATGRIELMGSKDPRRELTPPAFAAVLLDLARSAAVTRDVWAGA